MMTPINDESAGSRAWAKVTVSYVFRDDGIGTGLDAYHETEMAPLV